MQNSPISVGDRIPDFALRNQFDEVISIDSFLGKPFVIFFYPKDNTPGCTQEACGFRDIHTEIKDMGAEVIGISADKPESHLAFAQEHNLPYNLLYDQGNQVRKQFGIKPKFLGLLPNRITYVVDKNGIVRHIIENQFQADAHVLEALEQLKKQVPDQVGV